jgi:hypothetical protein
MLRRMGIRIGTLAFVAAFALTPAAAGAATDLYASPTGTSADPCTQAQPCDIVTAVNNDSSAGDDITIEPGTYGSPTPINTNLTDAGQKLTIHGEAGQPRPVIDTIASDGFNLNGGSSLSDVQIDDSGNNTDSIYVSGEQSAISDVIAENSGEGGIACYPDGTLSNSLCWANGLDGIAGTAIVMSSVEASFDNDTLISSGPGGDAVYDYPEGTTTITLNLENTIARGANEDIYAYAPPGATADVTASHSNFATVDNAGGGGTIDVPTPGSPTNQTAVPQLVNVIDGNFHELAGSPTIGAGVDSTSNGSTDLDGNPREIENTTDIGAYEFVPHPTCTPRNIGTKFQTGVTIQLECRDAVGAALTYALASKPGHGTASSPSASGAVVYKPGNGFSGTDRFTYTATSANGTAVAATILVTVGKEPAPKLSGVKLSKSTVDFTLNEAASITLTFARRGHKSITVKLKGKAGKNGYKIKKLKAGKYKLTIAASNAGGRTKSKSIGLKING